MRQGGGEDQGGTGAQAVRAWGPLRDTCSSLSVTTGESVQRRLVLGPGRGQRGGEGEWELRQAEISTPSVTHDMTVDKVGQAVGWVLEQPGPHL